MTYSKLRSFFTWLLTLCLVCFSVPVASVQAAGFQTDLAAKTNLAFLVKDTSADLSLQYVKLAYIDKSLPYNQQQYTVLSPTNVTTQHTSTGLLVTVPTVDWTLSTSYVALVVTNKQVFEMRVFANAQQPVALNPNLGYTLYADPPKGVHGTFQEQEIRVRLQQREGGYPMENLFTVNVQTGMKIVLVSSIAYPTYEWLGRDDDHAYFLRPNTSYGAARDGNGNGLFFQTNEQLTDLQVDMKNTDLHLTALKSLTTSTDAPNSLTRMDLANFTTLQGIYVTENASYKDMDFIFADTNQNTYEFGPSLLPRAKDYYSSNKATISFDTTWNAQLSKQRPVYHPNFKVNSSKDLGLVVSDSFGNRLLNLSDSMGQERKGSLAFTSQSNTTNAPVSLAGSDLTLPSNNGLYSVTYVAPANLSYPVQSASLDLQLVPYPMDYGINPVYEDDNWIDGYGEPGMKVELYKDSVLYQAENISRDGKFSFSMPPHSPAGTILNIRFSDPEHGFSDTLVFPVHELYPLINEVSDKDSFVTGLAPAGSTVTVSNSSKVIGKAVTPSNYLFKVPIAKQQGGTTLAVTVSNGKTTLGQATFYLTVKDLTAPKTPSIVGRITDLGTEVQGKAEPGATITIQNEEVVVGTGLTDADGNFDLYLDFPQTLGDTLSIYATDAANNTSTPLKYIVKDGTPPSQPHVNPIVDTDRYVTGTTEPFAMITVKEYFFNTVTYGTGRADKNGNFKVPVRSLVNIGAVDVFATDTSGNTGGALSVDVIDTTPPPAPTLKPFSSTDTMLTVTSEYGSEVYVTCDGQLYKDSMYIITMPIYIGTHKKGMKIEAYAVDQHGNKGKTTTIYVK